MDAVTTDPAPSKKHIVNKEVEEIKNENMILRRTTIDEIEFKNPPDANQTPNHDSES